MSEPSPSSRNPLSRRQFLGQLSLTGAAYVIGVANSAEPPPSGLVKRVVRSPENTYFTYPHSNGFLSDGTAVFASPTGAGGTSLDFIAFHPDDPKSARRLASVTKTRAYYSIARTDLMVTSKIDGSADVLDFSPRGNPAPRQIFRREGWHLAADNDISPDGSRVVVTRTLYDANKRPAAFGMDLIDVASGASRTLKQDWQMDHAHFSPFDPTWISFCDNRNNQDRMWLWNQAQAPQGKHLFNQRKPDGTYYEVGHERAMFNKPALVVIAYGNRGNALPRGLFEVGFDGSVRLVSESNLDMHCNISRDGRWAVVSLIGTNDPSRKRPDPNWLNTGLGYGFSDVMLVNMRTGQRQFLYRGTNATKGQPYEVQPSISPDDRWVFLKDAREKRVLLLELDQQALASFLA